LIRTSVFDVHRCDHRNVVCPLGRAAPKHHPKQVMGCPSVFAGFPRPFVKRPCKCCEPFFQRALIHHRFHECQ
ncbi:MAG: hypothetical protein ACK56I_33580, partial [bacterium]